MFYGMTYGPCVYLADVEPGPHLLQDEQHSGPLKHGPDAEELKSLVAPRVHIRVLRVKPHRRKKSEELLLLFSLFFFKT